MFGVKLNGYGDSSVLQYKEDLEKPNLPKGDEVLVQVHFSGYTKIRRGYMKQMNVSIPGIEYSGIIIGVGDGVKSLEIGDRVFGFSLPKMSTYSQYLLVNQTKVVKIPENLPMGEAAIYPCSIYTIWQLFKKLLGENIINDKNTYENGKSFELLKDRTVCIVGVSGPIGLTALIICKFLFGCQKIIGVCSSKNHEGVKKVGCDILLDYRSENYVDDIFKKDENNNEVKYIIDCYGGYDNLELYSSRVKSGQEYVTCGVPDGVSPGEFIQKISGKENCDFVGHKHLPKELEFVTSLFQKFSCFGKTPIVQFDIKDADKCHDAYHTKRPMGKMILKICKQ